MPKGHLVQPPLRAVLVSTLAQALQAAIIYSISHISFKPAASASGCSLPGLSLCPAILLEFWAFSWPSFITPLFHGTPGMRSLFAVVALSPP